MDESASKFILLDMLLDKQTYCQIKTKTCSKVYKFFPGCEISSPENFHFVFIAPGTGYELLSFALGKWSTKICSYFLSTVKKGYGLQWRETALLYVYSQKSQTLIRFSDRHYLVLVINTLSSNVTILKKMSLFSNVYCASRNNAFNSPIPSCRHQYYREM